MNDMVAAKLARTGQISAADIDGGRVTVRTSAGRVCIALTDDFESVKHNWLALQQIAACSYSQSYHWAEGWQRIVSVPAGGRTALVHGISTADETLFILPLELSRISGQRVIRFIGQDHANTSSGLFLPEFARKLKRSDVDTILCSAADLMGGADAAIFEHQPHDLGGIPNPFSLMPHSASANSGHVLTLQEDFPALFAARFAKKRRYNLARHERRLAEIGSLDFTTAGDASEAAALLDIGFMQKRERFAAKGIEDAFADVRYRDFYKEMAALEDTAQGRLKVSCLKVSGEVAATLCSVAYGSSQYHVLSSITSTPMQVESPGQILLKRQIEDACGARYRHEDFGTGTAPHKETWCDITVPLFDSNLPLSPKGHALCAFNALKTRGKRLIKTTPALWAGYQSARRLFRGLR